NPVQFGWGPWHIVG
ncbi:hypothetical protein A2U01_0116081, partial [Trifolium medium]|nr:hypothetical protein [Trifolium medium]